RPACRSRTPAARCRTTAQARMAAGSRPACGPGAARLPPPTPAQGPRSPRPLLRLRRPRPIPAVRLRACMRPSAVSRSELRNDDVAETPPADAGLQWCWRRGAPVDGLVESGQLAPVVDHEQHAVVP